MTEPKEESPPEAPQKAKIKPPALKLPAIKVPQLKLPAIHLPAADATVLATMILVGGLSVGSSAIAIHLMMPARIVVERPSNAAQQSSKAFNPHGYPDFTTGPDVLSDFSMTMERPVIADSAYVHPQASIIGYVTLGEHVFVAPQASIRGDVGKNIYIGDDSSIQDGAVIEGLPTEEKGVRQMANTVLYDGDEYSVYIAQKVTLMPQSLVYGPAVLENGVYLGMQAMVSSARIGKGSVLEPRAAAIGVNVPAGRYIPAGLTVTSQAEANTLPAITPSYPYAQAGAASVRINTQLAAGYRALYPTGN